MIFTCVSRLFTFVIQPIKSISSKVLYLFYYNRASFANLNLCQDHINWPWIVGNLSIDLTVDSFYEIFR